jgi:hypothetical protein
MVVAGEWYALENGKRWRNGSRWRMRGARVWEALEYGSRWRMGVAGEMAGAREWQALRISCSSPLLQPLLYQEGPKKAGKRSLSIELMVGQLLQNRDSVGSWNLRRSLGRKGRLGEASLVSMRLRSWSKDEWNRDPTTNPG